MPVTRTEPTQGLFNRNFRYRKAAETDISKTFARVRRQLKEAQEQAKTGQQALELTTVVHLHQPPVPRARGAL